MLSWLEADVNFNHFLTLRQTNTTSNVETIGGESSRCVWQITRARLEERVLLSHVGSYSQRTERRGLESTVFFLSQLPKISDILKSTCLSSTEKTHLWHIAWSQKVYVLVNILEHKDTQSIARDHFREGVISRSTHSTIYEAEGGLWRES